MSIRGAWKKSLEVNSNPDPRAAIQAPDHCTTVAEIAHGALIRWYVRGRDPPTYQARPATVIEMKNRIEKERKKPQAFTFCLIIVSTDRVMVCFVSSKIPVTFEPMHLTMYEFKYFIDM